MTKEQAIKLLGEVTGKEEINRLEQEGLDKETILDIIQEALDMGIEALEKQIAKDIHIYANGTEHCPNCDANLTGMGFKYCVECGQALNL